MCIHIDVYTYEHIVVDTYEHTYRYTYSSVDESIECEDNHPYLRMRNRGLKRSCASIGICTNRKVRDCYERGPTWQGSQSKLCGVW